MKTKQLFFTGVFLLVTLLTQSQDVETTQDVTVVRYGGVANKGEGNIFIGAGAGGHGSSYAGFNNTFVGHSAGAIGQVNTRGNENVFIGYRTGFIFSVPPSRISPGSGNVFIGANVGLDSYTMTGVSNKLAIDNSTTNTPLIWGDFAEDHLKFNGKVGIGNGFGNFPAMAGGVNVSGYNLFVNGGILTEEVRVMLNNPWADYVFEEKYNLPKLEELEEFIKENKHLPNVPSAKEVAENGIELGEIATIQQEKIEELTLYIIEQNKLNKEQSEQLKQQQSEIDELKDQVKLLLENQNNSPK